MIELVREKNLKWIMQKNVSSKDIVENFLSTLLEQKTDIDLVKAKDTLKSKGIYKGRSATGSVGTMGVRFSEICFYMFGYMRDNVFLPSPMTEIRLKTDSTEYDKALSSLVNLFSIQYPHPYSNTPASFKLYAGRLFIKLLLDGRINKRLYIDEMVWFLPFIMTIDKDKYEVLIQSILEYRSLDYYDKLNLFKSVPDYDAVFSNAVHEMKYYFSKLFSSLGVLEIVGDEEHNNGHLFRFIHGESNGKIIYRNDAFASRKNYSGYIQLSRLIEEDALKLSEKFSAFDVPTTMDTEGINSRDDWLVALYSSEAMLYLNALNKVTKRESAILETINKMINDSKYGSSDGKDFENSLKPVVELFRETYYVEIISGSGNTDLLCSMEDGNGLKYKFNMDAKTRKVALSDINPVRLEKHLLKHGSKFCIVVAPRFALGINDDIAGHNIVTLRAEDLGNYCYRECLKSPDGFADFNSLLEIIKNNKGKDITQSVRDLISTRYGLKNAC